MSDLQPPYQPWKKFPQKMVSAFMRIFSQASAVCRLIAAFKMVATAERVCFRLDLTPFAKVGSVLAMVGSTMKQVSNWTSKSHSRGSLQTRLRQVAAAGSLLDYWTDFGRLLT
jgi:hypothetical protein